MNRLLLLTFLSTTDGCTYSKHRQKFRDGERNIMKIQKFHFDTQCIHFDILLPHFSDGNVASLCSSRPFPFREIILISNLALTY